MIRSRIAISAFGVVGFLAACTDGGGTTSAPPTSAALNAEAPNVEAPNVEAPSALRFSAPSVGGGTIDFTQFAGQTLVMWFWAPT